MTAYLVTGFGAGFIALAFFLFGAYCADRIRALWWALADRVRGLSGPAPVYVPDHPRYGPLLDTPPQGIEVTRDDGVMTVRADLPVQRVRAEADPFTGPIPKLTDERYEELRAERPPTWAEPPPSMEELRRQYDSWQETAYAQAPAPAVPFPCCKHCEDGVCDTPHHVACIDCPPVYGETSVADVLAAELPAPTGPERVLQ